MKALLNVNENLSFEVEAKTQVEMFTELAALQEVFSVHKCGVCGGKEVRFVVRDVDGNSFFEMWCRNQKCRARLSFGQNKKGETLFPRRKDKDGNWIGNGGWYKWTPQSKANPEPVPVEEAIGSKEPF